MKNMSIILFGILLFVKGYPQSQNCDYYLNEVDKFDGYTKVITNEKGVGSGSVGAYKFSLYRTYSEKNKTDATMLIVTFQSFSSNTTWCTKPKSNLIFLLNDDTKVTLICESKIDCNYESLSLNYSLLNKDIEKLKKTPIKAFRISFSDGYDDCDVAEQYYDDENNLYSPTKYFIENINCLFIK